MRPVASLFRAVLLWWTAMKKSGFAALSIFDPLAQLVEYVGITGHEHGGAQLFQAVAGRQRGREVQVLSWGKSGSGLPTAPMSVSPWPGSSMTVTPERACCVGAAEGLMLQSNAGGAVVKIIHMVAPKGIHLVEGEGKSSSQLAGHGGAAEAEVGRQLGRSARLNRS